MLINPLDFPGQRTELLEALKEALLYNDDADIYMKRVEYDLERQCRQRDYFTTIQLYQFEGGGILHEDGLNGFVNYESDMPTAEYRINVSANNLVGLNMTATPTIFAIDGTISVAITDNAASNALYLNNSTLRFVLSDNAALDGFVFERNVQLTNNAMTTSFAVPAGTDSALYLHVPDPPRPYNGVKLTAHSSVETAALANINQVQAYYDPTSPTADITLTVAPSGGGTLPHYNATVVIEEAGNVQNAFTYQTDTSLQSTITFALEDLPSTPTGEIEVDIDFTS